MRSAHKTYHRSEPQVSSSRLGEIKKLPITATRAPRRRRGRGEGEVSSLSSLAWKYCELHVTGGRAQSSGQRAKKQDGRETIVDFYQLWLQNQG